MRDLNKPLDAADWTRIGSILQQRRGNAKSPVPLHVGVPEYIRPEIVTAVPLARLPKNSIRSSLLLTAALAFVSSVALTKATIELLQHPRVEVLASSAEWTDKP